MPFSSGTYSVAIDFGTEAASPPIEIAKLDTQMQDLATALSLCMLRDGTGTPTATIPFGGQNITGGGIFTAHSYIPDSAVLPTNGMYLPAANTVGLATNSIKRLSINANGYVVIVSPTADSTAMTINGSSTGSSSAPTLELASGSTSGYSYIRMINSLGVRRMELFSVDSGSSTLYGVAAGHNGINCVTGSFYLSMADAVKITVTTAGHVTMTGKLGINGLSPPTQVTGWGVPTGPAVVNNFSGAAATLVNCSNAIAQIITDLKAFGLYGA